MNVGVTGSRHATSKNVALIMQIVNAFPKDTMFVTGGCVGVDAWAAWAAYRASYQVMTILPADHTLVDPDWQKYCHIHYQMPPGSSYKNRNEEIVRRSFQLIAFPQYPVEHRQSLRSGTWQTIRLARKALIPVQVYILDSN